MKQNTFYYTAFYAVLPTLSACGGGVVIREDNIEIMEKSGHIICLDASPEVIYQRTKDRKHRPLLNVEDPQAKIRQMLQERAPFYARVKDHIDTSDLSVDEVVDRIIEIIK